jgi:transposase
MNFKLTISDRDALRKFQRNVSGRSAYVKVTTLILLDKGLDISEISDYLGIDDSTIYRYVSSFQKDGLALYLETDYQGYWGRLSSSQITELRQELKTNLYTDSKEVAEWIETRWKITYTASGVVDLLNRIDFTYKQTKCVPCEADAEKQQAFIEQLNHLLERSIDNESVIYFADGVHPTHNTRSTHAWIEKGTEREQPTVSGRDRININALLNAQNPTDVIAIECKSVNSQSTKLLYEQVLKANPDKKTIYIISDNAKYYRNKELLEWTKTTKIVPIFLPLYSPNLNLIERLWNVAAHAVSTKRKD